jgi:hypothetical protein
LVRRRSALIKKGADLPLLLIFAGVIGGLVAFGIIGLFDWVSQDTQSDEEESQPESVQYRAGVTGAKV